MILEKSQKSQVLAPANKGNEDAVSGFYTPAFPRLTLGSSIHHILITPLQEDGRAAAKSGKEGEVSVFEAREVNSSVSFIVIKMEPPLIYSGHTWFVITHNPISLEGG